METVQAWVTLIKDIITGLAAAVAAYVAWRGLSTWQRQLTANAEHGLARRVLTAVYKVRNALENYRMPRIDAPYDVKPVHDKFLADLEDADAALAVELLEAEAVWGGELDYRDAVLRLQSLVQVVKGAHSIYYADPVVREHLGSEEREQARAIVFSLGPYPRDEFSIDIIRVVREVENFLRPKLTLKRASRNTKP